MKTHVMHFLILAVILVIGTLGFFSVVGNRPTQLAIGIATAVAYVIWGILHHALQHDIHRKVVVEYALIGALAILLLTIALSS